MFQSITLAGNTGADAELRYTPQGTPVASFTLAVNERAGEQETTLWLRITCWRKLAELAAQYITKGKPLLIVGRVQPLRPYTNRAGDPACTLEVTADTIKFLPGGPRSDEAGEATVRAPTANGAGSHEEGFPDEIPF